MRILYGVVGEGMGHATRSRVLIAHLLAKGHEIDVVASSRAFTFLRDRFADARGLRVHDIHGLHLRYDDNELEVAKSVLSNLGGAPAGLGKNLALYRALLREGVAPDVVVSDFESWAFFFAKNHGLPVISVDNMQIINRCTHPEEITRDPAFQLAKAAVKVKMPGAFHYLVTTFFYPPVRKERTTLVGPILRPEIRAAAREPRDHVLVYQTAPNDELIPFLQSLAGRFVVYGHQRDGAEGNCTLRSFSEAGFIDDLRTARAVVAGGGFSLMSECVHLGVPMYAVPIAGQYEQELNARYLSALGYGAWTPTFDREAIAGWLATVPPQTTYVQRPEEEVYAALDALLAAAVA